MLDCRILCRIRSVCNGYRLFASLVSGISRRCPFQPINAISHILSDPIECLDNQTIAFIALLDMHGVGRYHY